MKCPKCNGLGITYFVMEYDQNCTYCDGKGKVSRKKFNDFREFEVDFIE